MHAAHRLRRALLSLAIGLLCVGQIGCPSPTTTRRATDVLRYPIVTEPTTLDPALVSDTYTAEMLQNVHLGLVGWAEKGAVVPFAAKDMPEVSVEGKVYTFTLRDGLKFHNGRAVTAQDVKYSIERSLQKSLASPVSMNYLDDIEGAKELFEGKATELKGVKALDEKTVQITLKAARPYFLGKLTYPTAYILAKEEVEKGPKSPGGPATIGAENMATVGCGPFKLVRYTRQDKLVLEANADFVLGKPKLTRIERPIVLDAKAARMLYDTGQVDVIILEKGDYEKDRNDPALKDQIQNIPLAGTVYLAMVQTRYRPFQDRRVRIAFAHAIDRDAIVRGVLLGVHPRGEGILPDTLPGYRSDFKGYAYDPGKAKALLAEAGYPGGRGLPPLTLCLQQQQPDLIKSAQVIKEQLAAVGVDVSLREMEWSALLTATQSKEIDLFLNGWMADYMDPQNFLSLLLTTGSPENRVGYSNPAYDALCAAADKEPDPKKRLDLYHRAERIVVDDAPWVPLYYNRQLQLVKPYVRGLRNGLTTVLPHTETRVEG